MPGCTCGHGSAPPTAACPWWRGHPADDKRACFSFFEKHANTKPTQRELAVELFNSTRNGMVVQRMDPRIAPPCTDDDSTTGPCGPAAKCLQCKKTARILLDQAAVGRWDTVMNALRVWPKLVNYEPEFEEGHKTLVSVATPLYEGGPPKALPPFAPCSAHAQPRRSAPHPLRTRSAPAPCALCRSNPNGPTARTSRRGGRRRCC